MKKTFCDLCGSEIGRMENIYHVDIYSEEFDTDRYIYTDVCAECISTLGKCISNLEVKKNFTEDEAVSSIDLSVIKDY